MMTASSRHPGVVQVTLGDGSVRTISDTINQATWWNLGMKADGNPVSNFEAPTASWFFRLEFKEVAVSFAVASFFVDGRFINTDRAQSGPG